MSHPILRNTVLKTPDYLAPREFLFLEERGNPALFPTYLHRKLPRAASQPLLTFRFPGEQWLKAGPSDTSLNRKETKESFRHISMGGCEPAAVYK